LHVERVFAGAHGRVPGGRSIVLALGKLGSREMTAASDLDLMFVYDFDPARPESDGSRPLHAVQYYTRIAQRLISCLTVATRQGRLYEVDMRLRPSGNKGPLATQFTSFVDYQANEAETWEHMALTRARPVAGNAQLGAQSCDAIRALLMRPRGRALRQDVYEVRRLIAQAKGDGDPWDLKLAAGGLVDIEFVAQYLLLRHANAEPSLVCVSALAVIETAAACGLLDAECVRVLVNAYRLFTDVTQILRLTLDPGADPRAANEAVKRRLAKVAAQPSIGGLESCLCDMRAEVRRVFEHVLSPG
ncbi:MAG: bifunctional [glutamine synthetase] adenylyltransferase/[glutamine synthetase]-adenylyl-L-tyrosine phosphorylase, partial [Methylocella sp.]